MTNNNGVNLFNIFGGADLFSSSEAEEKKLDASNPSDTLIEKCDDSQEIQADSDNHNESVEDSEPNQLIKKEDPKEKKPVFNFGTFIAFAGRTISITKLFNEEVIEGLDLETVRKRLERDFPELSKQRTKMEWDEKKNLIVPIIFGGKKGVFYSEGIKGFFFKSDDLIENIEPINILVARNGYYDVRKNDIGLFVTKVQEVEEFELCHEAFKMSLPQIPLEQFSMLISFFSDYAHHELEVMGVFYWDREAECYTLDIPFQWVSKGSINVQYSETPPHMFKVAEIHSHNTMKAYFSDVDNEDELGELLYGVVGKLKKHDDQVLFNIQTRAGVAGRFINIDSNVIIEGEHDNFDDDSCTKRLDAVVYPAHWHNRVKLRSSIGRGM